MKNISSSNAPELNIYKYDQLRAALCVKCRIISQFLPLLKASALVTRTDQSIVTSLDSESRRGVFQIRFKVRERSKDPKTTIVI
jgi:hypothetical protein